MDLEKIYDTPIKIELKGIVLFADGKKIEPNVRTFKDMLDVLKNQQEMNVESDKILYYMYRAPYTKGSIRFDITVIPPSMLGSEYVKTYGHYHTEAEKGLAYPEVYQVLKGEVLYILQRKHLDESIDVILVKAKAGDVVLMPPNYGHVSVNTGKEILIMSNLVSSKFQSDYSEYKRLHGAAIYYTKQGIIKNPNYKINNIEQINAKELNERHGVKSKDLLLELYFDPKKFDCLERPSLLNKK